MPVRTRKARSKSPPKKASPSPKKARKSPAQRQKEEEEDRRAAASDIESDDEDEPLATQKPDVEMDDEEEEVQEQKPEVEEIVKPSEGVEGEPVEKELESVENPTTSSEKDKPSEENQLEKIKESAEASTETTPQAASAPKLIIQQSAKPLTSHSLETFQGLTDYWINRILMEPEHSQEYYKDVKLYYGLAMAVHDHDSSCNFGRLHCRMLMAELVVNLHKLDLLTMDRDLWKDAIFDEVVSLTQTLMRQDATAVATYETSLESLEDETINPAQPLNKLQERLRVGLTLIQLHMALAPIRATLEQAIDKKEQPNIPSGVLREIITYLKKVKFDDEHCLTQLGQIIQYDDKDDDSSTDSDTFADTFFLADIQAIEKILRHDRVFSFDLLKEKLIRTIVRLDRAVYGEEPAQFIGKKYHYVPPPLSRDKKRRRDEAQVAELVKNRKRLLENGEDPLPEALEKSKQARAPRRPNEAAAPTEQPVNERESTVPQQTPPAVAKSRVEVEDDLWDDKENNDDQENQTVRRFELQSPRLERVRSMIRNQTCEADEGIFDENGKVNRRRAWTAAEDAALRNGIAQFGVGKWKQIKDFYPEVLHNRQTVQIKDRHRTLVKSGQF